MPTFLSSMNVFLFLSCALLSGPVFAQLEPQPGEKQLQEQQEPVITKNPELMEPAQPDYPQEAQDQEIEGVVTLKIVLDASGFVSDVTVEKGVHPLIDQAAIEAAYNLVFSPAEVNGEPAPIALLFSFTFEMAAPPPEVLEEAAKKPVVNFEGLVRQAGSKKPLELAEVTVERILGAEEKVADEEDLILAETYSDKEGRFELSDVPLGKHLVKISISGHETFETFETFEEGKKTKLIAYIRPTETNLFETIVRKRKALKEVSRITLSREEVKKIPGTFGDPIRVLENLPGMAKLPLFGGALLIRGAAPADSGIYFDSVGIPVLYHFGGLTSVVNPEFLETIDFFPGGFGAKYGRAIAGVVDVSSRDLNFEDFQGSAEVDLIDSGFFLGGPIKLPGGKDLQVGFAARRSYLDALLPLVFDAINTGGTNITAIPVYWDYQAKSELRLGSHRLSLFGFGSSDKLSIISNDENADSSATFGTATEYHRLIGKVKSKFGKQLNNAFQIYTGRNIQRFGAESSAGINLQIEAQRDTHGIRNALVFQPQKWLGWENGFEAIMSTYNYRFDVPVFAGVGEFPRVEPPLGQAKNQILESDGTAGAYAGYSELQLGPISGLTMIAGLRAERLLFRYIDERDDDKEKESQWDYLNPRFTLRFSPGQSTSFKGAFGIYNNAPTPQQLLPALGNPNLELTRAFQWIGGFEHRLTDIINVNLQWYFTKRDQLVQNSSLAIEQDDGTFVVENYDNDGYGQSFGLELLVRHELTKYFFGWIAYTLSRSESDTSEEEKYMVENTFDQSHILTVVAQTKLPWELTFGGRFRLVSGSPETLPFGSVHDLDTDNFSPVESRYIRPRKPAFHQLDLRIDRKFTFDAGSLTAYLDLLNVYNQQNVEFWQEDYRYRERAPITGLPILPVIGLSGEF